MNPEQYRILEFLYDNREDRGLFSSHTYGATAIYRIFSELKIDKDRCLNLCVYLYEKRWITTEYGAPDSSNQSVTITASGMDAFNEETTRMNQPPRGVMPSEWKLLCYLTDNSIENIDPMQPIAGLSPSECALIFSKWESRHYLRTHRPNGLKTGPMDRVDILNPLKMLREELEHSHHYGGTTINNTNSGNVTIGRDNLGVIANAGSEASDNTIATEYHTEGQIVEKITTLVGKMATLNDATNQAAIEALTNICKDHSAKFVVAHNIETATKDKPAIRQFFVDVISKTAAALVSSPLVLGIKMALGI